MANTYSQIYIQVVFAPEGRQSLIAPERKEELHKYITGIVTRQGQKLIAVHCMPDHTHILIGLKPDIALSDLVRDIKTGSSVSARARSRAASRGSVLDILVPSGGPDPTGGTTSKCRTTRENDDQAGLSSHS